MRENGERTPGRTRRSFARRSWLIVTMLVLAGIAAGGSQAMHLGHVARAHHGGRVLADSPVTITAKAHEGQRSDGTWTGGNITTYKEGDTIAFRFDLTATDATSGDLQVRFTGNDGTCLFFTDYFVL